MDNSWHKALSTTLSNMNFEPSRVDPDIWLRMSYKFEGREILGMDSGLR